MIHTVKGFGIVNKAEIDVFLDLSCFLDNPKDYGNLISGSSAFSKTSLNIWKFTVQVLLKPGLENFEHYFTNVWDECNCAVVWAFFGTAFLWDWNENWLFPVLWPLLSWPGVATDWLNLELIKYCYNEKQLVMVLFFFFQFSRVHMKILWFLRNHNNVLTSYKEFQKLKIKFYYFIVKKGEWVLDVRYV